MSDSTNQMYDDRGSGPALIFLHGYPFDRSMWREQIDYVSARGYRGIAPHLYGHEDHRLKSVPQITTMPDMARDVASLMNELNLDRAIICGLSMGGYVTFEFAKLFPERTQALVLAGTRAPADNESEKQTRAEQVRIILNEGMKPIAEATLPKLLAPRTHVEKPQVVALVSEMITHADPDYASAAQRGMAARRDYSDDLAGIDVPTLIIVGREDPIRPVADAEFMRAGIRNAQMEIIEDAAHMTNLEQPQIFNRALLKFVSEFRL
jgi:pimeloyl-ACP methyl ester carboxylesterase